MSGVAIATSAIVRLPMACRCGEERRAEWNARRAAAFPEFEGDLVTALIHDLGNGFNHWDFTINYVHVDQWMAVGVKGCNFQTKAEVLISLQCDTFEDGLTAIWEHVSANYDREPD